MEFLSKKDLISHGNKKKNCNQCTFKSCTTSRLSAHILKIHGEQKPTKNRIGKESTITMTQIIRGSSTFYGCSICDSNYVRKERMEKHKIFLDQVHLSLYMPYESNHLKKMYFLCLCHYRLPTRIGFHDEINTFYTILSKKFFLD